MSEHDHLHLGDGDKAVPVELARRTFLRPYVLTKGRTSSSLGVFALHSPILALVTPEQLGRNASPEDRKIIELCQTPTSVAEVSARMSTPVGVLRVLVGDLEEARLVTVREVENRSDHRDVRLLERLLEGIRAL